MTRVFKLILVLTVILVTLALGCQQPAPTTKATTPATTTQAPAPPAKTLKIGLVFFFGNATAIDGMHGIEALVEADNKAGGISIGGEKYKIELVEYDSNFNQATAAAAINRLISVDNVKFVLSDTFSTDFIFPITEQNKVLLCGATVSPALLSPKNNYSFSAAPFVSTGNVIIGWFAKKFPQMKTVVTAFADNQIGKVMAMGSNKAFENFGMKPSNIFYPTQSADLSAVGTKIKSMNPDVFASVSAPGAQVVKAAWEAGFRGQIIELDTLPASLLKSIVPVEALEGFIGGAEATEFDPPATKAGQDFKAAYMTKFNKWGPPGIGHLPVYNCLKAALDKAGSPDPEKVAAAIGNGLVYESPIGTIQMTSRPDMGNNRTVDSVIAVNIKKISSGKISMFDAVTVSDAVNYAQAALK